jgi:hypothetical protein
MSEIPRGIFGSSCEPPLQPGELPVSELYQEKLRQGFESGNPALIAEAVLDEMIRQDCGDVHDWRTSVEAGVLAGMAVALEIDPDDFTTVMINELMAADHPNFQDRTFLYRHEVEQLGQ